MIQAKSMAAAMCCAVIMPGVCLADSLSDQQMQAAVAAELARQQSVGAVQEYDQNGQANKANFIKNSRLDRFYNDGQLQQHVSEYQVTMGTIIPGVMITGLNSDLPGMVMGQVSENVYDSATGRYLLIPQGTKMVGTYDSRTTYAQTRVIVVWQRLIFPDNTSVMLDNMQGVDQAGYTGLHDKVNSHFGRVIWSALIGGAVTAGVAAATDVSDSSSYRANAGAEAADNISNVVDRIVDKNLNVQPTLIIRPGYEFNIFVSADLLLKPYQYD